MDSLLNQQAFTTEATEYGKRHEPDAKVAYGWTRPGTHLHDSGLIVNPAFSFLGCTPDTKLCDGEIYGALTYPTSSWRSPSTGSVLNAPRLRRQQLERLFTTAYCVVKQELSFAAYPSLVTLQIANGVDLPDYAYQSDKAAAQ